VISKVKPLAVAYFESDGIYVESYTESVSLKYFKWWIPRSMETNILDVVERFVAELCPNGIKYLSEAHFCGEQPVLYFYNAKCFKEFAVLMSLLVVGVPKSNVINIVKNMNVNKIDVLVDIINRIVDKYGDIDEHKEEIESELRLEILQHIY